MREDERTSGSGLEVVTGGTFFPFCEREPGSLRDFVAEILAEARRLAGLTPSRSGDGIDGV